jgi:hypothetical protein
MLYRPHSVPAKWGPGAQTKTGLYEVCIIFETEVRNRIVQSSIRFACSGFVNDRSYSLASLLSGV